MTDQDKTSLLAQLFDGDAQVANELRALVRRGLMSEIDAPPTAARTVGELRARANAIRLIRERAQADKAAAEQKRREAEAEISRRARLQAIARRGESVWREIEAEIERRNTTSYDQLRQSRRPAHRSAGDRRGKRCDRGLRPPLANDPRTPRPKGAVHRTTGEIWISVAHLSVGEGVAGHDRR